MILFIGLSYHQKTGSSEFFLELLRRSCEVRTLWMSHVHELDNMLIEERNTLQGYEAVVCWQLMPSVEALIQIDHPNVVLVPMYDQVAHYGALEWIEYRGFRFVAFCKQLYLLLCACGLNTMYVQYAPPPKMRRQSETAKPKLFFWQRKNDITWDTVRLLFDLNQLDSVHFHTALDPQNALVMPSEEEIKRHKITFSHWFESQDDYSKAVSECDIFMAPRLYEGIGMAFLEAMAMGLCVVAPNHETMNEYIVDGSDGLLYDPKTPAKIDCTRVRELGRAAMQRIEMLYRDWNERADLLSSFIRTASMRIEPEYYKGFLHDVLIDQLHYRTRFYSDRFSFSVRLNNVADWAESLEEKRLALYGAGRVAHMIASFIPQSIVCVVDRNTQRHGERCASVKVEPPEALLRYTYDYVLITVLGREEEITHYLEDSLGVAACKIRLVHV